MSKKALHNLLNMSFFSRVVGRRISKPVIIPNLGIFRTVFTFAAAKSI